MFLVTVLTSNASHVYQRPLSRTSILRIVFDHSTEKYEAGERQAGDGHPVRECGEVLQDPNSTRDARSIKIIF